LLNIAVLSVETRGPAIAAFALLLYAGHPILPTASSVAALGRHPNNVRPLPFYTLLASGEIAAVRITTILPLRLPIDLLTLHLRTLPPLRCLTLRLPFLPLRSAIELRHLSLLPLDLRTLSLTLLSLRPVPLRHLALRLLPLHLRPLCLTVHLRERSLHLRHLPLHLRSLLLPHLRHGTLRVLPHLRGLLPLHLRTLLRSLSLDLLTAAAAPISATVSAPFTLRGNFAETANGEHQQERKKCK
jgi:hypothetical protein